MVRIKCGSRKGRYQAVLDVARTRLERDGLAELSMSDVARDAEVSPATLSGYFDTKEKLFVLLYAERLAEFHDEIAPVCEVAEDLEDLLATIVTTWLPVYHVYGREMDVWALLADPGRDDEIAGQLVEATGELLATIAKAVDRIMTADGHPLADRGLAMPFLWSNMNGLADHFTSNRQLLHPYSWDELTRFAARTVVAGLRSGANASVEDR